MWWCIDVTGTIDCIDPPAHGVVPDKEETALETLYVARTEPGQCCQELRVSSQDIGQQYQETRMSVYR